MMSIKKNEILDGTISGSIIEDPTIFNLADGALIKMIPNPAPTKEEKGRKGGFMPGFFCAKSSKKILW